MARFALLLPREEMVEPAGRIARELEMDVVLNQSVPTERILDLMEDCRAQAPTSWWPEAARRPFSRSTPTSRWWRSSSPAWRSPGCSTGPAAWSPIWSAEDRRGDHPQHGGEYSGL